MSLRLKLLTLIAGLLTGVLGVSFLVVYRGLAAEIRQDAERGLAVASRTLQDRNRRVFELLSLVAGALEQEPGFRAVLHTHDPPTIADYVDQVRGAYPIDLLAVTDRQGQPTWATPGTPSLPLDLEPVLAGETSSGYQVVGSELFQLVAVPMLAGDDMIVGALVVGQRFGAKQAGQLADQLGCQLQLQERGRLITATVAGPPTDHSAVRVRLDGVEFAVARLQLDPGLEMVLLRDTGAARQAARQTGMWLAAVGVAAMGVAFLISLPLVGRMTHPVLLLERAEARLKTIFESCRDGMLGLDLDGHIQIANPAAALALGRPSPALLGQALADLLDPETRDCLFHQQASLVEFERGGRRFEMTRTFLGEGDLSSLIVLRDAGAEADHEQQKRRLCNGLARSLRQRPQALLANLERLEDLLADRLSPDPQTLSLEPWGHPQAAVATDADCLHLVLDNLLANARSHGANPQARVECRLVGGAVEFSVDSRHPMPADWSRPGYPKGSAEGGGPGLGLFLCMGLLERLGSRLQYAEHPGGSRVFFSLPLEVS